MEKNRSVCKKEVIEKLKISMNENFKEKLIIIKGIFEMNKSIYKSKKALDIFIERLLELLEEDSSETLKENDNTFFKTDKHQEIFYLLNFEKGFDEELGINRYHYGNKELAKKWKKDMMKKYHTDVLRGIDLDNESKNMIVQNINKIFNRLVGEA